MLSTLNTAPSNIIIPDAESREIEIFCMAHKTPLYDLPEHATIVWLGHSKPPNLPNKIIPLYDLSPQLDLYHPFLGGSAGTYAITNLFRQKQPSPINDNRKIAIISYRKFVSNISGINPETQLLQIFLSQSEIQSLNLANIYNNIREPFLLPRPLHFDNGIYGQYASVHCAPDLLRFTAIAVEMGFVSWQESAEFLSDRIFIPGGIELGIYPASIFLKIIDKLSAICIEFLKHHKPVNIDAYQRRALSFCSERLGGYLLRKELVQIYGPELSSSWFGYILTLLE